MQGEEICVLERTLCLAKTYVPLSISLKVLLESIPWLFTLTIR